MGTGSFPVVKSGRSLTLTPHPLLVPWSWKGRAISLFPLWAVRPVQSLSACTKVRFTLPFTLLWKYIQTSSWDIAIKICLRCSVTGLKWRVVSKTYLYYNTLILMRCSQLLYAYWSCSSYNVGLNKWFLGAFLRHVPLSAWNNLVPTGEILIKFDIWVFKKNIFQKNSIFIQSWQ